jgi:HEAT repeat protein
MLENVLTSAKNLRKALDRFPPNTDPQLIPEEVKQYYFDFLTGHPIVEALGRIGCREATDVLSRVLKDASLEVFRDRDINHNPFVRGVVAKYFPSTPFRAASETTPFIREAAARALGRIGGQKALAALVESLTDDQTAVGEAVVDAVGDCAGSGDCVIDNHIVIRLLEAKRRRSNVGLCTALRRIGEPALTLLVQYVRNVDIDSKRRGSIVQMLGIIGSEQAVDAIAGFYKATKSKKMRDIAARALAKIGTPKAIEALHKILNGSYEDTFLHLLAVETIGEWVKFIPDAPTARSVIRTLWWQKPFIRVGDLKDSSEEEWATPVVSNWDAIGLVSDQLAVLSLPNRS